MAKIPLALPEVGAAEREAAARVLASDRLARGPEIAAFEAEFAHWVGVRGGVMLNSGTSGLMVALRALGVGPGDEVLMPALTFIACANAILHCGAVPVLVDVERGSGNLDVGRLAAAITPATRAILVVHLFGRMAAMARIAELADSRRVPLVEDACEAPGARRDGRRAGAHGAAGVFGFYPNKVLSTGEGGMVVSDDEALLQRCRALVNQGRGPDGLLPEAVPGYSFRSTEVAAALGRAQLGSLALRMKRRAQVAARYHQLLAEVPGLELPTLDLGEDQQRSWFAFPVLLPAGSDRAAIMGRLAVAGIETADYFPPVHTLPGYAERVRVAGPLSVSEDLGGRLMSLPFWGGISAEQQAEVAEALTAAL